jgi:hypothetical protein
MRASRKEKMQKHYDFQNVPLAFMLCKNISDHNKKYVGGFTIQRKKH